MTFPGRFLELSTTELLRGALDKVGDEDEDEFRDYVFALRSNGSEEVFEQASRWCRSQRHLERILGADILGQLGGCGEESPYRSRSLPILYDLLRDTDPNVLDSALVALGHLKVRDNLEPLLALIDHPHENVRYGLVFSLLGNESESAVAALIQLSSDHDEDVRDWATFGLGTLIEMDTPEVRAALLARTDDDHDDTRGEALVGLAERGDRTVLPALLWELESGCVGRLAVEAARDLGVPELLSALQALTRWWDVDNSLLQEAIASCQSECGVEGGGQPFLGKCADSGSSLGMQKTTLLTQLVHGGWKKRMQATEELAGHRDTTVLVALIKALRDRSFRVRWRVIEALGAIGGPAATSAIVRALDDGNKGVQMQAVENLSKLGGEDAVEPLIRLLGRTSDALVRVCIIDSMRGIGDQRFVACLLDCLPDDDEVVRSHAAWALADIGTEELIPVLEAALAGEESAQGRLGLHEALFEQGREEHLKSIVELLADEDYRVRCASAHTLGAVASDDYRGFVVQVLSQALEKETIVAARSSIESNLAELRAAAKDAVAKSDDEDEIVTVHQEFLDLSTAELLGAALDAAASDGGAVEHVIALHINGSEEVFGQANRWCRGQNIVERILGANILGQLGNRPPRGSIRSRECREDSQYRTRSLPTLYALLRDTDPGVLGAALNALGHLRIQDDLEPLLALVEHPDEEVRYELAFSLLGHEAESAVDALIQLSSDPDGEVRDWATFGLGTRIDVDTSEVRAALHARTDDYHDDTRKEALLGLAKRGDRTVLPALVRELESGCVGKLAVEAARDLGAPELSSALQALTSWWDVDNVLLQEAIASCQP